MLCTHLMLLEAVEMVDVTEATAETEDEIVDVDEEVDEVELELGIITADELELELELELLEVLEMSVDVVLELETTDCDGAGTAIDELGLLVETAALEVEEPDAAVKVMVTISHTIEA